MRTATRPIMIIHDPTRRETREIAYTTVSMLYRPLKSKLAHSSLPRVWIPFPMILTTALGSFCDFGQLLACNLQSVTGTFHQMISVLQHIQMSIEFISNHQADLLLSSQSITKVVQILILVWWQWKREQAISISILSLLVRFFCVQQDNMICRVSVSLPSTILCWSCSIWLLSKLSTSTSCSENRTTLDLECLVDPWFKPNNTALGRYNKRGTTTVKDQFLHAKIAVLFPMGSLDRFPFEPIKSFAKEFDSRADTTKKLERGIGWFYLASASSLSCKSASSFSSCCCNLIRVSSRLASSLEGLITSNDEKVSDKSEYGQC